MAESCANCQLYIRKTADSGICRRFPPITTTPNTSFGTHPLVKAAEWCGEWAQIDPARSISQPQ